MSRVPVASGPSRVARTRRPKALAALLAAVMLVLIVVVISALAGGSGTGTSPGQARAAAPAATASAPAPLPLPVVYAQAAGWREGQLRPAVIYVGEGGAPYVKALRWSGWTAAGAHADGYLRLRQPGCTRPAYQCRYLRFRVQVQLSQVQAHDGVRYYARMRWTYTRQHARQVIRWQIDRGFWSEVTRPGLPLGV
jgi:hypothetical protein